MEISTFGKDFILVWLMRPRVIKCPHRYNKSASLPKGEGADKKNFLYLAYILKRCAPFALLHLLPSRPELDTERSYVMKKMKGSHKKKKNLFKKLLRRLRRSAVAARWLQLMQHIGFYKQSPSLLQNLSAQSTKAATQAIELDNHFALDISSWDSLLARLLSGVQSNRQASVPCLDEEQDALIVAVTLPAKDYRGDNFLDELSRTLRSVAEVQLVVEFPVKVAILSDEPLDNVPIKNDISLLKIANIGDFSEKIYHDAFILFVRSGDEIAKELGSVIKKDSLLHKKLIIFDLFFAKEEKILPIFMPGFNILHGIFCDYFRSRFLIRGDVLAEAIKQHPKAAPYELARVEFARQFVESDRSAGKHIPLPLIKIDESEERLLAERIACFEKRQDNGVLPTAAASVENHPRVSVIINTKDKGYLLRQLLTNLLNTQMHLVRDIIIVSNETSAPHAVATLREFVQHERVTILEYRKEFNFSAQSNIGAAASKGDYLLFLNDDIVPVSTDWIHELLRMCALPKVGIVAPLLVYPDERAQHAGMFLGFHGVAGHTLRFARLPVEDYVFMGSAPRLVSVVTGAVFMIERTLFDNLNGFDTRFATYIQDVDLCLRVRGSGYHVVFDPWAVLIHMESVTVKAILDNPVVQDRRGREHALFVEKWKGHLQADPFHNPNFEPNDETLRRIRQPKEAAPLPAIKLRAGERH